MGAESGRIDDELDIGKIVDCIDATRSVSNRIRAWWRERSTSSTPLERFDLVRDFSGDTRTYGFFDSAAVDGRQLRLMGCVQDMFFDRQKNVTPEEVREQVREFVLRYLLRVCHSRRPQVALNSATDVATGLMRLLSWNPEPRDTRVGFGYENLLMKRRSTGLVQQVPVAERGAIPDLRTLETNYDWWAMRVNIFDFNLEMAPLGAGNIELQLPLREVTYVLLTPEWVVDVERPAPGVLGEYGIAYGLLPYTPEKSILAYGPGFFQAGFQTIVLQVLEDGSIHARAEFIVNRPDKVLSIDVAPVDWGFRLADLASFNLASRALAPFKAIADALPLRVRDVDPIGLYISAANAITGGLAERYFGISLVMLEKMMLVQHFKQHHEMLETALVAWRKIPDWTRQEKLPDFCHRGFAG